MQDHFFFLRKKKISTYFHYELEESTQETRKRVPLYDTEFQLKKKRSWTRHKKKNQQMDFYFTEDDNAPVMSMNAPSLTPSFLEDRYDETEEEYETEEQMNHTKIYRKEPKELNVEEELGALSPSERLVYLGTWLDFPEPPYYRFIIAGYLEEDVTYFIGEIAKNNNPPDDVKQAMSQLFWLVCTHLWKCRFRKNYRERRKRIGKAEGELAMQAELDRASKLADRLTTTMHEMTEHIDDFWKNQNRAFSFDTETSDYHEEVIMFWCIAIKLYFAQSTLISYGSGEAELGTYQDFREKYEHQDSMFYGTNIDRFTVYQLCNTFEAFAQHWNETPMSKDIIQLIEQLFRRYCILCTVAHTTKVKGILNQDGAFEETETLQVKPAESELYYGFELGYHSVIEEEEEEEENEEDEEEEENFSGKSSICVTEDFLLFGQRVIFPMLFICQSVKRSFEPIETPEDLLLKLERTKAYCGRCIKDLASKDVVRTNFRKGVFDFILKPGEAINFKLNKPTHTFNSYNIIMKTRSNDVDRLQEKIVKKPVEYIASVDPMRWEELWEQRREHKMNKKGEVTIEDLETEDLWSCHWCFQYSCLSYFFATMLPEIKMEDIVSLIPIEDGPYMWNTLIELKPVISLPRILPVAGSFLVYLPWEEKFVTLNDWDLAYRGGLLLAFVLGMELLQHRIQELMNSDPAPTRIIQTHCEKYQRYIDTIHQRMYA